jgi:hypothetical protein
MKIHRYPKRGPMRCSPYLIDKKEAKNYHKN